MNCGETLFKTSGKYLFKAYNGGELCAPLIEIIGGLPFIVHLWGGTGAGKTVA